MAEWASRASFSKLACPFSLASSCSRTFKDLSSYVQFSPTCTHYSWFAARLVYKQMEEIIVWQLIMSKILLNPQFYKWTQRTILCIRARIQKYSGQTNRVFAVFLSSFHQALVTITFETSPVSKSVCYAELLLPGFKVLFYMCPVHQILVQMWVGLNWNSEWASPVSWEILSQFVKTQQALKNGMQFHSDLALWCWLGFKCVEQSSEMTSSHRLGEITDWLDDIRCF